MHGYKINCVVDILLCHPFYPLKLMISISHILATYVHKKQGQWGLFSTSVQTDVSARFSIVPISIGIKKNQR